MSSPVTHILFDVESILAQFNAAQWLDSYWAALSHENEKVNLVSRETTIGDFKRMVAESLLPFTQFRPKPGDYIDVGSGGGIPAVPLLRAGLAVNQAALYERTKKKALALERIVSTLGISGVSVIPESFGEHPVKVQCTLVTMSWVALNRQLLNAIDSVLAPGGTFVYYSRTPLAVTGLSIREFSYSQPTGDIHKYFSLIGK